MGEIAFAKSDFAHGQSLLIIGKDYWQIRSDVKTDKTPV